jgi:transcriptional regulator with XRE-family HTH domain
MKNTKFGEILRTARKMKGLSQADVARLSGLALTSICRYESGVRNVTLEKAAKILALLDTTINITDMSESQDEHPQSTSTITVGEKIRVFRVAKGMTQQELADASGVAYQNISQYERGVRTPKMSMVRKIAAALSVRVYDLEQGEDIDSPDEVAVLPVELAVLREENERLRAMFDRMSRMTQTEFMHWRETVDMTRSMLSKE